MGGTKVLLTQPSLSWHADTAAQRQLTCKQAKGCFSGPHITATSRVMCMDAYGMYEPGCSAKGFLDLSDTEDSFLEGWE